MCPAQLWVNCFHLWGPVKSPRRILKDETLVPGCLDVLLNWVGFGVVKSKGSMKEASHRLTDGGGEPACVCQMLVLFSVSVAVISQDRSIILDCPYHSVKRWTQPSLCELWSLQNEGTIAHVASFRSHPPCDDIFLNILKENKHHQKTKSALGRGGGSAGKVPAV